MAVNEQLLMGWSEEVTEPETMKVEQLLIQLLKSLLDEEQSMEVII